MRNNEKTIQPPVWTNEHKNLVEEYIDEGYIDNIEEIHLFQEENNTMHLTLNDCEYSLNSRKENPKNEFDEEVLFYDKYKMFFYALQDEIHRKWNIRPI